MRHLLEIQEQLLPDLMDTLKRRYTVLRQIRSQGMVGRRTLAASLAMTERVLRAETDFLKSQGLLEIESLGMRISRSGELLLDQLEPAMKDLFGLDDLEEQIREAYGLRKVVVVPGDSESSPDVKRELGRAGARALLQEARIGDTIAVTGGSTLAEVAEQMGSPAGGPLKGAWFVPARGGLGESVEIQANTIASKMAKKVGAEYRLLHVPDLLSDDAYQSLVQDPNIQEIVDSIRSSRIIIHGIGDAMEMARRRRLGPEAMEDLRKEGAVAESFGYYFSEEGTVVHRMLTLGLRLEDIVRTEIIIGIAGGVSKAQAIHSVLKFGQEDILVLDEAAAMELCARIACRREP
ncbi:sugar-binding domain-containing protein [Paenibacillus sp. F411]|uniref:Transcriptional regulator, DeoR family protein n=1 Tax=Paenibacillus algicola TaxID=2565926 RepID=A0A4P8XHK6_9BACL|nr:MULTISPECIES: sugar-binding domain-containing protein [Paenibacillus]MBO2945452.1 sugar-binding domain-containing protein [Paenibacillus sp. F411]QCT00920.1 transcriptional regulator, DeoR family protein [Paenibacillus algicola]